MVELAVTVLLNRCFFAAAEQLTLDPLEGFDAATTIRFSCVTKAVSRHDESFMN